jgi:hypothetical protein
LPHPVNLVVGREEPGKPFGVDLAFDPAGVNSRPRI